MPDTIVIVLCTTIFLCFVQLRQTIKRSRDTDRRLEQALRLGIRLG